MKYDIFRFHIALNPSGSTLNRYAIVMSARLK